MRPEHFIDTHVHVACADVARFPRRPTGVGSGWWAEPSGQSEAVLDVARRAGAAKVVVVQAVGAYGTDSSCAASAVNARADFTSLVVAPDLSATDHGAAVIEALAVSEHITGVRLFGVTDDAPWLDDGRIDTVFELCAARGLVAVPAIFSDRLGSLHAAMERHPDVAVALDHCAFPDMAGPAGERALFEMADLPSLHLKVSSHVLAAWLGQGRLHEVIAHLVEAFGASRLCWGSDHPQQQGTTYQQKLDLAMDATSQLSADDRDRFFHGTAHALRWG
ncbi:MAG: amidohydrolase [Ilumatobacteraceae bacterium]|nr:amidohydrolase [Ilumatobacteraceae bacterium]